MNSCLFGKHHTSKHSHCHSFRVSIPTKDFPAGGCSHWKETRSTGSNLLNLLTHWWSTGLQRDGKSFRGGSWTLSASWPAGSEQLCSASPFHHEPLFHHHPLKPWAKINSSSLRISQEFHQSAKTMVTTSGLDLMAENLSIRKKTTRQSQDVWRIHSGSMTDNSTGHWWSIKWLKPLGTMVYGDPYARNFPEHNL